MVKVKMMNENLFAKLVKEYSALGELVRTKQEEKQSVLNEFDRELARYKKGNISENTLASSIKKINLELIKLDKNVRETIDKANKYSARISELVRSQKPVVYRARESGLALASASSKKKVVKKVVQKVVKKIAKKKPVKKKAAKKVVRKVVKKVAKKKVVRKAVKKKAPTKKKRK